MDLQADFIDLADSDEDGEVHPSDALIERAKGRQRSRSPSTEGYSPERTDLGRPPKRRRAVMALNLSQTESDASARQQRRRRQDTSPEPDLDLVAFVDSSSHTTEASSGSQAPYKAVNWQPAFKAPTGVTIIDDEEEVVQVAMLKALRAPRYFKNMSKGGSMKRCFRCGETGHLQYECKAEASQQPCSTCGQLGHTDYDCKATIYCYKCNNPGHLARDCPQPMSTPPEQLCIQCGDLSCIASSFPAWARLNLGCSMKYSKEDMQQVICLTCKKRGHYSCAEAATKPAGRKLTCWNCGGKQHSGLQVASRGPHLLHVQCSQLPRFLVQRERQDAERHGIDIPPAQDSSASDKKNRQKKHRRASDPNPSAFWSDPRSMAAVPMFSPLPYPAMQQSFASNGPNNPFLAGQMAMAPLQAMAQQQMPFWGMAAGPTASPHGPRPGRYRGIKPATFPRGNRR